jgi:branched-chain amino acid transport system substrate-binding protein
VLNDQSGVFSTYQGIGSVIAAQMAVEDYGSKAAGKPVEVITADHQNKTDVGVGIARRWYDTESVDAIFDLPNSAIALAVAGMSEQKNKVFVGSGAGTALLTGEKCTPNTGALDLRHLCLWPRPRQSRGRARRQEMVLPDRGLCLWPRSGEAGRRGRQGFRRRGARRVRHPLGTADYASFLLQAQASGRRYRRRRQRRRRHHHLDQAGRPNSASPASRSWSG